MVVVTTGRVPEREISDALLSADVYLHADHAGPSAGRRTSIVAALAHGMALVSYSGPDHAEQLVDGANMLVVGDGAALAETLRALHIDPQRRAALGAAARATFEQHFSWRVIGDAVSAVLEGAAR